MEHMGRVTLAKLGGACAVLYTIVVVAFFFLATVGTDVLEAENAAEFLPILEEDQAVAATALWLLVAAPLLIAFAGLGMSHSLRHAGPLIWVAGLAFIGGGLSVLYRSFVWLAMTYELAPAYAAADETTRSTLAVLGDTLDSFAVGADMVGAVLIPGIGVPLFSLAILRTGFAQRWIAWLGFPVAILGGWLTLLVPLSELIELITFIGFAGFWVWMVAAGVTLWRAPERSAA
jgi:hypothetical protein